MQQVKESELDETKISFHIFVIFSFSSIGLSVYLNETIHMTYIKHKLFGQKYVKVTEESRMGEQREIPMNSHGNRIH